MMMERKANQFLKQWLSKRNRKPLILRGARQVGKSTLVRNFCASEGLEIIELNLEIMPLTKLSLENFANVEDVLTEISIRLKKDIDPKRCLLFLDEIQAKPEALPLLRYLYEQKPDLPVIAAGSLLEFVLEAHEFSMPVGRIEYYYLGPFTFSEYLKAMGENHLLKQLEEKSGEDFFKLCFDYFDLLKNHLRTYYFIGGMPEALRVYQETKSLAKVRDVHRSLLQTYRKDFPKYSKHKDLENIESIFDALPHFIGKKVRYSEIAPDLKSEKVRKTLKFFRNAKILHFCHHTNAKAWPLRGLRDDKTYRYFFLDIGLFMYFLGVPEEFLLSNLETHPLVEGILSEQFIAQHLAYKDEGLEDPELFYWVKDKKSDVAELDFLIGHKGEILPVEVKSGASGKLKSLNSFMSSHEEKKLEIKSKALRFDLKKREICKQEIETKIPKMDSRIYFDLYNIPIFAVEFFSKLVKR